MKRIGFVLLFLPLFAAYATNPAPQLITHKTPASVKAQVTDLTGPQPPITNILHRLPVPGSELDEYIGDTLSVGDTYYNAQHNCTVSRMVGFFPGQYTNGETGVAFFTWMDKPSETGNVQINFNRAWTTTDGNMVAEETYGYQVNNSSVGAYSTLAMDQEDARAFPAYHVVPTGQTDVYVNRIADEWSIIPGLFTEVDVPNVPDVDQLWPHAAYGADGFAHMVTTENNTDDLAGPQRIYYTRTEYLGEDTTPFEPPAQVLVTDLGRNISADIATSNDGQRVAIGQTISRTFISGDEHNQYDQDIYIWLSEDGGVTWDFDSPMNLTHFIDPVPEYLPDSTRADQDTLRAYCDVNVYFDHDDVLHVAFTAAALYYYEGTIYITNSKLFHWDETSDAWTLAADGWYPAFDPGSWNRNVCRPNMYQDPQTRILWMAYTQFGSEEDSTDVSESGFANSEVYITASPEGENYGKLWAKPVNVTNTAWMGENPAPVGQARSESCPSIALNNDGDYLNLFYVLDYDGGNARQTEGTYTQNNAVWQKVPKQALLDEFEANGEWVRNYPLHIDSTQFWADEENWQWGNEGFFRGAAVSSGSTERPTDYALNQNYPNPFNPTTQISFSLPRAGLTTIAVYDVLGREVATLVNRAMPMGSHTVTFDGTDLSSGVYFVKMTSGAFEATRKMLLVK